jgi:hypothetical protein
MRMPVCSRLPVALAAATLALLGAPGSAAASRVIAPPGNSGVSQYVEVVPGANGSTPVGATTSHGPVLSAAQRKSLEAAGAAGKALAAFTQQTGVSRAKPASSPTGKHSASSHTTHGSTLPGGTFASSPVRHAAAAGGGLGWGLYAALGAILLAGLGFVLVRRRAA